MASTDFGQVASDLQRAATSFALLTSSATAFGASLNAFRQFERQMVFTNAIAQGTQAQFRAMKDAARGFALATTVSAVEAGEALQNLAQAGFTAEESLKGMNGVLLLASATMSDVAQSSDMLSSNIRAFGLDASETMRVANLFTAAMNSSLATMDKLTFAMRQVGPVADVANLSIEETTAFLGELFNIGLRGEQAGTSLRNVIVRLVRPTGEASEILREMGIATLDATGNFRGLEAVLQDLAAANLSTSSLAKIAESEALAGFLALMKAVTPAADGAASSYQNLLSKISGTDAALVIALENLDTLDGSMKLLNNTASDLMKTIGEAMAPTIRDLSDWLRGLARTFRELDDDSRNMIASMAGWGALGVTATAAFHGLYLVFKLMGGRLLLTLTANFIRSGAAIAAWTATVTAARVALTAFVAVSRTAAIAMAGFLLAGGAAPAAAILAIAAALWGAAAAFDHFREKAEDAGRVEFDPGKYAAGRESFARRLADAIGTDTQFAEVDEKLRTARQLIDSDLVRLLVDKDLKQALSVVQSSVTYTVSAVEDLDRLQQEVGETFIEFADEQAQMRKLMEAKAAANEASRQAKGPIWSALSVIDFLPNVGYFASENKAVSQAISKVNDFRSQFTEEELAAIDSLVEVDQKLLDRYEQAKELQEKQVESRREALDDILRTILNGEQYFVSAYDEFKGELSSILSAPDVFRMVTSHLVDRAAAGEDITDQMVTSLIFSYGEDVDGERAKELLSAEIRERNRKVFGNLRGAITDAQNEIEKQKGGLASLRADMAKTLGEAMRFETEAAVVDIEEELRSISKDFNKQFNDVFSEVNFDLDAVEDMSDHLNTEFQKIADDLSYIGDTPGFRALFDGSWLAGALDEAIDENSTPEEINEALARIGEVYTATMELFVEEAKKTFEISPEQAADLEEHARTQLERMQLSVLSGSLGLERTRERRTKQFDKKDTSGEKAAQKALRIAQKIRDAYMDAANSSLDAREAFYQAISGFGVDERINISFNLETEGIALQYEQMVRDIQDKVADIELNFEGPAEDLVKLKKAYADLIPQIIAARDAEIEASKSFTKSMERRREALDLFMRDLQDTAMEAGSVYAQVGAGIAAAYAEYNKELVTTLDITKNATLDMLDAVSGAVSDFIFDNENAGENFKKTMLGISKDIVAGYTKQFMQQAISSSTGGGGSIFGNAVALGNNPKAKNDEMPGVGTGGILGMLFPGLMGGMQDKGQQAAEAAKLMQPLQEVLQSIAAQTRAGHSAALREQQQVWSQFAGGLRGTLNAVLADIRSMSPSGAGAGFGQAFPGVAASPTGAFGDNTTMVSAAISDAVRGEVQLGFDKTFSGGAGNIVNDITSNMITLGKEVQTSGDALVDGINGAAGALGVSAKDLATIISYETAGTFDAMKRGPTTQWGQHRGLIQFGEPQAQQYGVDFSNSLSAMESQLGPNGAIVSYMKQAGVVPGTSLLDMYSAVNAGSVGRYNASDANNGGAPGNVAEKVAGMGDHMAKAEELMRGFAQEDVPAFIDHFATLPGVGQNVGMQPSPNVAGSGYGFTGQGFPGGVVGAGMGAANMPTAPAEGVGTGGFFGNLWGGIQSAVGGLFGMGGGQGGGAGMPGGMPGMGGGDPMAIIAQMQQIATQFQSGMQTSSTSITQTVRTFEREFRQALQAAVQAVRNAAASAGGGAAGGMGGIGGMLSGLMGGSAGSDAAGAIAGDLEGVLKGMSFARGGEVRGPGTGTSDSIMALLSNKEFVVNAKAAEAYRPILEAINQNRAPEEVAAAAGGMPRFATGGSVGGFEPKLNSPRSGNRAGEQKRSDVVVNANYTINVSGGGPEAADNFARSASQHAKALSGQLKRAQRNA